MQENENVNGTECGETSTAPTPQTPDWQFGGVSSVPQKRTNWRFFFAMFGGVILLCALLLWLTLWLGNGGIKITRNVNTERTVFVHPYDTEGELLAPEEAADVVRRSTVTVVVHTPTESGHGSGFIYTADGYIVTNHHVVATATDIQVILADGRVFDATVVGTNAANDLAVVKIEASDLPAVTLGNSSDLLTGDDVVVVGTPASIDYAGTATFGKVSYPSRLVALSDGGTVERKMTLIQTDTAVNNGNSGGPMADMYGHVIGIVVMKVANFDSIGFAIPIDGAKPVIDALIKNGKFEGESTITEGRSLIGITGFGAVGGLWYTMDANGVYLVEEGYPGAFYAPVNGVYVTDVTGEGVQGKLYRGDVITQVNGLNIYSMNELIAAVNRNYAGTPITLTMYRNGTTITVTVVLTAE